MASSLRLSAVAFALCAAGAAGSEEQGTPQEGLPLHQAQARWLQSSGPVTDSPESLAYDDASDFTCTLGQNCTGSGSMPSARGICIRSGISNECWDVCNPKHSPQEYRMGDNPAINSAFAGLVAQVRAGLNSFVQCPGALKQGDMCPPGNLCTYSMRRNFKIPEGRGMCVVDALELNSRACWDMCDLHRDPTAYAEGGSKTVVDMVRQVRASGICPGTPWWRWLLIALLTLLVLVCCVGIFVTQRMSRKRTRGAGNLPSSSRLDAEMSADFLEPLSNPREDKLHSQEMLPEDYVSARGPPMHDADSMMPPEPPHHQVQQDMYGDLDRRQQMPARSYSQENYGGYGPPPQEVLGAYRGHDSMRVAGMDEPHLPQPQFHFPGLQQPLPPQTMAQVATPDLVLQATQYQVATPTVSAPPYRLSPVPSRAAVSYQTVQPGTFHTVPATFTTQVVSPGILMPTSSVQVRTPMTAPVHSSQRMFEEPVARGTPAPQGNAFFSQLQRR